MECITKISVIIPVYNGEKYIEECLESIFKQTINNMQVICVDDGSTDSTLSILERYKEKKDNIVIIKQLNQGSGMARNNALKVAEGKYIAFMDADDFYLENAALEKMVQYCEQYNVKICGSLRSVCVNKEISKLPFLRDYLERGVVFKYRDVQCDYHYHSFIFERKMLEDNCIYFPDYRRYQDPPFFAEAMHIAETFVIADVEMYCYRRRTTAMTYSEVQVCDLLKGIKKQILFAKEKKYNMLLENNFERLNKDFLGPINKSIEDGNFMALQLLREIEVILNNDTQKKYALKTLKWVRDALKKGAQFKEWDYIFPYHKIPFGSRIILYGAGVVGKEIKFMIERTGYCDIVLWVDKNYLNIAKGRLKVDAPENIKREAFDYVLVAVENWELFEEIKKNIVNMGIDVSKVVGPIEKKREKNYMVI